MRNYNNQHINFITIETPLGAIPYLWWSQDIELIPFQFKKK